LAITSCKGSVTDWLSCAPAVNSVPPARTTPLALAVAGRSRLKAAAEKSEAVAVSDAAIHDPKRGAAIARVSGIAFGFVDLKVDDTVAENRRMADFGPIDDAP
jgi:hypothetical protein